MVEQVELKAAGRESNGEQSNNSKRERERERERERDRETERDRERQREREADVVVRTEGMRAGSSAVIDR